MKTLFLKLLCTSSLVLWGCTFKGGNIQETTQGYIDNQQYVPAMASLDKIVKQRKLDATYFWALNEGVRISVYELNDFKKAIYYLDVISSDSNNFSDIVDAQKKKAEIYFTNFQNYARAIIEYEKLNLIASTENERIESLLFIARSHFYLNQFKDSEIVIKTLLKLKLSVDQQFYANQLLGNIQLAVKNHKESEEIFLRLLKDFPEKAVKENIFLNLALVYEESNQIDKAVELLKLYREKYSPQEYIDLRIKRLLARKKNMPGAKGLRK